MTSRPAAKNHPSRRTLLRGLAATAGAIALTPAIAMAGEWKVISRERGVMVTIRQQADDEFPTFKGVGRVDAPMWEVFALLEDMESHTRWMHRCSAAFSIGEESKTVRYLYNRTDAPWPVVDRDVVVRSAFSMTSDGNELWTKFKNIEGKYPPVDGVVRMPFLVGHYRLMRLDDDNTLVEYQVNADPGGSIPDWLVKQGSKDLPMRTIVDLRKQARLTRGDYDVAALKRQVGVTT